MYGVFGSNNDRVIFQCFRNIYFKNERSPNSERFYSIFKWNKILSLKSLNVDFGARTNLFEISLLFSNTLQSLVLQGLYITKNDFDHITTKCIHLEYLIIDMPHLKCSVEGISNLKKLKSLELTLSRIPNPEHFICCKYLTDLSLPSTVVDAGFLNVILQSKKIKKLEFKGLTPKCSLKDVERHLLENKVLKRFRVWGNLFKSDNAVVLSKSNTLKHIVLSCRSQQLRIIEQLFVMTPLSSHLTNLTLQIHRAISIDIAQVMSENLKSLRTLTILDAIIHPKSLEVLSKMSSLKRLLMCGEIDDASVQVIINSFKSLSSLAIRNTSLSKSKITDIGISNITNLNQLYELSIQDTMISDTGIKCILENASIRRLNILNTLFTVEGLSKVLKENHTIKAIVVGPRGKKKLEDVFPQIQFIESEM
ncbi:hypothetical protein AKO1_007363 [Acrasis kona]|uniref:Uncharacterized protein n=1 Tax=Acrasis kona TaxID=1008807 RepID=A0AAW2YS24_9EUKA